MMEAERASETLDCSSILSRLVAREDFIAFSRRESFKSYINVCSINNDNLSLLNRVILKKLKVAQLVKKFLAF
jgi:hypothetical protein